MVFPDCPVVVANRTRTNGRTDVVNIIIFLFLNSSYPCEFGGKIDDKVYTSGLEEFGKGVLTNVWDIIKAEYIDKKV